MRVHGALGLAGRPRRIEPERRVVAARRGGRGERLRPFDERIEIDRIGAGGDGGAGDDHVADLARRLGHRLAQGRLERRRDDRRLGAAVREHVRVVGDGQQRVDGDRDDAGVERAEEGDRPLVAVEHQQQDALLAANAQAEQGGGETARAVFEIAVGERAAIVDVGDLAGAAAVRGEQVLGEIEGLGRLGHGQARGSGRTAAGAAR